MSDEENRIGVALFGCGWIGVIHLRHLLLNEKADIRWIIDENLPHIQDVAKKHKIDKVVHCIEAKDKHKALKDERLVQLPLLSCSLFLGFTKDQACRV